MTLVIRDFLAVGDMAFSDHFADDAGYGMVWYGINLFDITEIHNTLL